MTEIVEKKLPVVFEWELAPNYRHAKYYDVYARYPFGKGYSRFPVLIGCTKGTDSDRIYPLNHPKFNDLKTKHFACDPKESIEEHLQGCVVFNISDSAIEEILEYIEKHMPKE